MRKSVIRLLVAVALLVSGSLVPVYAANNPMPGSLATAAQ